ncbi:MAG: mechanosensitive ion channel [Roseivivax sp.]|nr:mechanosensitive ion channel [Roseivivax sp.]
MTRLIVLVLIAFCLIAPPLPSPAQTTQPTGTISVTDDAQSDAAIAVRIREILKELDGYEDVTVTVSAGIVTLRGTTLDSATATRLNDIAGRVEGVVAIENEVQETTDVVRRLDPAVTRFLARVNQAIAFLPLFAVALVAAMLVVGLGWLIARMRQPWDRIAPNAFIADILRSVIRLGFAIAGLVVALDILGATALLSTILGAAGIIGLAIGFAVKDTVENFIASVLLSIRQPFRPNDAIEINGDEGKVIRLTSRATILLSWDGNHIRIPNSTVFKSRIVNFSRNQERRFKFTLGLAPDSDFATALKVAERTLKGLPFVLQTPAVDVWIDGVGDSTVNITLVGWIDQTQSSLVGARGEAIRQCLAALSAAGIEMPEPTYRLVTQTAHAHPPAQPAPAAAPAGHVLEVEAKAEQQLEAIVRAERKETRDQDLLAPDAPRE